jgi:hypothetical protein
VSADGKEIVSGAGGLLVTETLRVTGLGGRPVSGPGPAAAGPGGARPREGHRGLAVAVALGGDCLADIAVVRAEPGL